MIKSIEDRESTLKYQTSELSNLGGEKGGLDRELEMLDKEIEDIKVQSKQYTNDIKAFHDEKEELTERVD